MSLFPAEAVAVGDLYVSIAKNQKVLSHLSVQTYGRHTDRADSYLTGEHKVYNIECIKTGTTLGSWKPGNDHSKWCVTMDQNKPWTCIADVNRAFTQFDRRGGALCINDIDIMSMFKNLVGEKNCPVKMEVDNDSGDDTEPMICSE